MTADTIVDLFFAGITAICLPFAIGAFWAYLKTGKPDPNRWTVRAALWVAVKLDNATWPARRAVR